MAKDRKLILSAERCAEKCCFLVEITAADKKELHLSDVHVVIKDLLKEIEERAAREKASVH